MTRPRLVWLPVAGFVLLYAAYVLIPPGASTIPVPPHPTGDNFKAAYELSLKAWEDVADNMLAAMQNEGCKVRYLTNVPSNLGDAPNMSNLKILKVFCKPNRSVEGWLAFSFYAPERWHRDADVGSYLVGPQ